MLYYTLLIVAFIYMTHRLHTKTKIVGTLGPNSADVKMIEKMLQAGLTVARINMSHGDHPTHAGVIKNARAAAAKSKRPLAILQDLSGPKIRIGDFDTDDVTLINGHQLILTIEKCIGTVERVSINYPKLPKEVGVGMFIYLNDGRQKLQVTKVTDTDIHTTIISGGTIKGRRGVNIPDADLSISSLTPKDKKDVLFGLEQDVDFMTLSFVRNAKDIHDLRKLIPKDRKIAIVAKIETKFAIENLDEIIDAADVIMVARGDLAIEVPLEKVPLLQKKIIRTANRKGKPVITATQMLDSMRIATVPTRAEVTDIANAIIDGTDALMLSDETTIGNHPDLAISIMAKIALEVENDSYFIEHNGDWNFSPTDIYGGVSRSIALTIEPSKARAIVALSESGNTGRMVARYRPHVPVIVLTPNKRTFSQMLVVFGCEPVLIKNVKTLTEAQALARKTLLEYKVAEKGDNFILAAGIPFGSTGATNMMMVEKL